MATPKKPAAQAKEDPPKADEAKQSLFGEIVAADIGHGFVLPMIVTRDHGGEVVDGTVFTASPNPFTNDQPSSVRLNMPRGEGPNTWRFLNE